MTASNADKNIKANNNRKYIAATTTASELMKDRVCKFEYIRSGKFILRAADIFTDNKHFEFFELETRHSRFLMFRV